MASLYLFEPVILTEGVSLSFDVYRVVLFFCQFTKSDFMKYPDTVRTPFGLQANVNGTTKRAAFD